MIPSGEPLSGDDRDAILAEYDRLIAQPVPVNKTSAGCAILVLAAVLFFVAPVVLRRLPSLRLALLLLEVAAVLVGIFFSLFGGGGGYARASVGVESALEVLSKDPASVGAKDRREAAAFLIANAYYSDGPGMTTTFKFEEARTRLGGRLPYVIEVERLLIAERRASPVFTLRSSEGTSAG